MRKCLLPVLAACLWCFAAFGYEYPLTSKAIREAYFIGKDGGERTAAFLAKYKRQFPIPKAGPQIASIELETPYAMVIERSWRAVNFYSPDAVQEFLGKQETFRVQVRIFFTASYNGIVSSKNGKGVFRGPDFWRDFKVTLAQERQIQPDSVKREPMWAHDGPLIGATITLEYRAENIASAPATVTVVTPEDGKTSATFDLTRLK